MIFVVQYKTFFLKKNKEIRGILNQSLFWTITLLFKKKKKKKRMNGQVVVLGVLRGKH